MAAIALDGATPKSLDLRQRYALVPRYRMYLRMYPRQSGENVYFHVGMTRGEHDASLPWPFRLKHRLAVLDQVL